MVADALQQGQTRPDRERQRGDGEYKGLPGAAVDGELGWRGASTVSSCAVCAPHQGSGQEAHKDRNGVCPPKHQAKSKRGGVFTQGVHYCGSQPGLHPGDPGSFQTGTGLPQR